MFDVNPTHHDLRIREIDHSIASRGQRPTRSPRSAGFPIGVEGLFSILVIAVVVIGNTVV